MRMLTFLFRPGLKLRFDYMRLFQIFTGPFGRAENPSPVWEYWARIFSPGMIEDDPTLFECIGQPSWIAPRAESISM